MISMTLPTLWASKPFYHFLDMLVRVPIVNEIHIINNYPAKTPNLEVLKNPKIKMYNQEKNIGCHPAWNMGVANATAENMCVFSDDIIFDLKLLYEVDDFLNSQDENEVGLVAMNIPYVMMLMHMGGRIHPSMLGDKDSVTITMKPHSDRTETIVCGPPIPPEQTKYLFPTGVIEFNKSSSIEFGPGGGALFFFKRKNWIEIPKELVKDFGDRWCWHTQRDIGRQNYLIQNCFFYHAVSVTCESGDFNGLEVDTKNESGSGFRNVINRWRLANKLPISDYP